MGFKMDMISAEVPRYPDYNASAKDYAPFTWVLVKDQGLNRGRVGLVRKLLPSGKYLIQFGPDGPFEQCKQSQMLLATQKQVDEKEGNDDPNR